MASIDTGAGGTGKRSVNFDLPLIPFIDFLLCLVSFLLITAVWSQMARINADARVPGPPDGPPTPEHKALTMHVEMRGSRMFQLVWKEGNTVVSTTDVERNAIPIGDAGDIQYVELGRQIEQEWRQKGVHRAAEDARLDQAVVHTDNATPFKDLIAVIDAINTPKRDYQLAGMQEHRPAFNVTFAVN